MHASPFKNVRTLWLSLVAGIASLTLWGVTAIFPVQGLPSHLSLPPVADAQTNGPGGGGGVTG
jgi:hypothetical protein